VFLGQLCDGDAPNATLANETVGVQANEIVAFVFLHIFLEQSLATSDLTHDLGKVIRGRKEVLPESEGVDTDDV